MTAQPQRIGFLLWPATRALTLSLAEEALRAARRLHPEALYEPLFLLAEAPAEEEGWRLPGTAWNGRLEQCSRLFLVADEAPAAVSPALGLALKQLARSGAAIGALSAGIYPLAQLGLVIAPRCTGVGTMTSPSASPRSSPPTTCSSGIATA